MGELNSKSKLPSKSAGESVAITGELAVGKTLTATARTGFTPSTYQWTRANADGTGVANISGATSSTYTIQAADAGKRISCNVSGVLAVQKGVTIPAAVTAKPVLVTAPSVNGTPTVGTATNYTAGVWTGADTVSAKWQLSAAADGSNAVDAASTPTYTPAAGDVGKYLGIVETASNAGGPTVAKSAIWKAVQAVAASYYGGSKSFGNSQWEANATPYKTVGHAKVVTEAPFEAVRVWVGSKATTGGFQKIRAVVAATETMERNTAKLTHEPRVGGVFYNALKGSNPGGWVPVTWENGADTFTFKALPPSVNRPLYACSDWIPLESVPRSDVVGARPAAMLRIQNEEATAISTNAIYNNTTQATRDSWWGASGQPYFRESIYYNAGFGSGAGGVVELGTYPTTVVTPPQFNGFYCWLEYKFKVPSRSVAIVGDSTIEAAYGLVPRGSWVDAAMRELSTQEKPIICTNLAGSGHSQVEYLEMLKNALDAGFVPTDVVMLGFSQNGFGSNSAAFISRNQEMITRLKGLGCRIYLTTTYAVNGYAGAQETERQKCITEAKRLAAAGDVILVDTDALISDYTNPATPIIKAAYNSGDNVHANNVAARVMADALKAAWQPW